MRYERAQRSDLPALTTLWQTCFGDEEASIWEFWKIFDKISVFIARENAPIAMLCALPVTLFDADGESHAASYLYAVCTAPDYRNMGICAQLMDFAENALKKEGSAFTLLVPSSEKLFDFYKKRGYQTAFYHTRYTVTAKSSEAKIKRIRATTYQNLRQMQLYANFVSYDEMLLGLQEGLFRIETQELVCCAAAQRQGKTLIVKELLPDHKETAAALAAHLKCDCAEVRTEGLDSPFGMAKSLCELPCPQGAYLGLAFD